MEHYETKPTRQKAETICHDPSLTPNLHHKRARPENQAFRPFSGRFLFEKILRAQAGAQLLDCPLFDA